MDAHERRTAPIVARKSTARAEPPRLLSRGTTRFEHDGIVVHPAAVVHGERCEQLTVVVPAFKTDPSAPARIDIVHAQVCAFVVSASIERASQGLSVALYLRYPGNVHIAVDADLKNTTKRIERRHEQLLHEGRARRTVDDRPIPGQILAYVLSSITSFDPARGDVASDELAHRRKA